MREKKEGWRWGKGKGKGSEVKWSSGCDLSLTFSLVALGAYVIKLRSRLCKEELVTLP